MRNRSRAIGCLLAALALFTLIALPVGVEIAIEGRELRCLRALSDTSAVRSDYEAYFGPLEWTTSELPWRQGSCATLDLTKDSTHTLCSEGPEDPVTIGFMWATTQPDVRGVMDLYERFVDRAMGRRPGLRRCPVQAEIRHPRWAMTERLTGLTWRGASGCIRFSSSGGDRP